MPAGGPFQSGGGWAAQGRGAAAILLAVLGACGFEIWAWPIPELVGVWPAKALALGVMLRLPAAARPAGWAAAALAFALGALAGGAGPVDAALAALVGLAGIVPGYAVLARLPEEMRRLHRPVAMKWIVGAAVLGGLGAAGVGALAGALTVTGGTQTGALDGGLLRNLLLRWGTEAVNFAILLPVLLSAPSLSVLKTRMKSRPGVRKTDLLPAGAIALSFTLAAGVEEPGAIGLPVLALLWCGLVFPVFLTALVALCFNLLVAAVFSHGAGSVAGPAAGAEDPVLVLARLAAVAVATAPILLSMLTHHRSQLMERLHLQALRDPLTGLLNRAAFREEAALLLRTLKVPEGWPSAAAVLLIDLDQVRAITEGQGSAAGDAVLREVARRVGENLRQSDLVGRLNGEEFVMILRDCAPDAAVAVGERLLRVISGAPIRVSEKTAVEVTASIGLTPVIAGRQQPLDHLLNRAARALYFAKEKGRNQVVATGMPEGRSGQAAPGAQPEAPVVG